MGRRRLVALALAAGSLLGVGLYAKRGRSRERVDLYFADGTMVTVDGGSPEAALLIPQAREALRSTRP